MKRLLLILCSLQILAVSGCRETIPETVPDVWLQGGMPGPVERQGKGDSEDRIPDFSRVGYHYGDRDIPDIAVVETITVEAVSKAINSGETRDTTEYIQTVIDRVGRNGGGAILLKDGTYNVSRILFLDWDGTVLRGESRNGTVLKSSDTTERPIVFLGRSQEGRPCDMADVRHSSADGKSVVTLKQLYPSVKSRTCLPVCSAVADEYTPVGREYLRVENPALFSAGQTVLVYRPKTMEWISDIGMDRIPDNRTGVQVNAIQQWQYRKHDIFFERRILDVRGDSLFLDAPVVMALDKAYGGGAVYKMKDYPRVRESGVESIGFDARYDASVTYNYGGGKKGGLQQVDEAHAWSAVYLAAAENCWVRDVNARHMGLSLAEIGDYSIRITVCGCKSECPVSALYGGRRYAYLIGECELCLVRDCTCDEDRHGCITNGHGVAGPNVFYNCSGTHMHDAMGTHMAWSMGTLFDNISTDGGMAVEDRGYSGNGHGWSGVNTVFWNVTATSADSWCYVVCQNPWAPDNTPSLPFASTHSSGRNYAVGIVGRRASYDQANVKNAGNADYYNNLGLSRPSGLWYPEVLPESRGTVHVSVFDEEGRKKQWWPSLTVESSTHPESLYISQLEDRHARGIYLGEL